MRRALARLLRRIADHLDPDGFVRIQKKRAEYEAALKRLEEARARAMELDEKARARYRGVAGEALRNFGNMAEAVIRATKHLEETDGQEGISRGAGGATDLPDSGDDRAPTASHHEHHPGRGRRGD